MHLAIPSPIAFIHNLDGIETNWILKPMTRFSPRPSAFLRASALVFFSLNSNRFVFATPENCRFPLFF